MFSRRIHLLAVSLLAGATIASPALAADAPAKPALLTPDQIKLLFQTAQYKEANEAILHLLNSPSPPAPPSDHHEMLLLRIECLMQLKQFPELLSTLQNLTAAADKTGDADNVALYSSLSLLIQRSSRGSYTPRTGASQTPIDIISPTTRTTAYSALFTDELATLQSKADGAKSATAISTILDLIPIYTSLHRLEKVADSSSSKTDAIATELLTSAGNIFTTATASFDTKISVASANAQTLVPDNGSRVYRRPRNTTLHSHPAGLTPDETTTLKSIVLTCQQIHKTADTLSHGFNNTSALTSIVEKTDSLQKRAETVLSGQPDPGAAAPTPKRNKKN